VDGIVITTTVSLDCAGNQNQQVIHLVQGDYGTRELRLVPVSEGRLIDMQSSGVIAAKVLLSCEGQEDLLIDCELGDRWASLVPTQAMTSTADTWHAQLALYTSLDPAATLTTAPFDIIVHGTVYHGDAVEHTDNRVVALYFEQDANHDYTGKIVAEMSNGEKYVTAATVKQAHTHDLATTSAAGFMSAADKTALDGLADLFDQSVKTTASVVFAGLTVGSLTIAADGTITGAVFT